MVKIRIIFCVLVWNIMGCVSQNNTGAIQGISGELRWVEGNLMPAVGDTSYVKRAEGKPVQREIHIYKAVKIDDALVEEGTFFKSVNSELVKKIRTNDEGKFRIALPSGYYSIFVLEQGRLYANSFDGNNFINPVTVEPGKFTDIKISINYKAYY